MFVGRGERAVFGVALNQLDMVPWVPLAGGRRAGSEGLQVPRILALLKEHLLSTGGLDQEGIFRKAPGDVQTQQVRASDAMLE